MTHMILNADMKQDVWDIPYTISLLRQVLNV